jgi:hypothetical protein
MGCFRQEHGQKGVRRTLSPFKGLRIDSLIDMVRLRWAPAWLAHHIGCNRYGWRTERVGFSFLCLYHLGACSQTPPPSAQAGPAAGFESFGIQSCRQCWHRTLFGRYMLFRFGKFHWCQWAFGFRLSFWWHSQFLYNYSLTTALAVSLREPMPLLIPPAVQSQQMESQQAPALVRNPAG